MRLEALLLWSRCSRDWGKKLRLYVKIRFPKDCCVGAHEEAGFLRNLDAVDRFSEYAVTLDADIVSRLQSIQMNVEEQARRRPEFVQPLANEHSIRAQINMFLSGDNLADEAPQFGIDKRFTAANGNDGRAAFLQRVETLFDRKFFPDRVGVLANAAAAGARQITGVQRLQHHDERKFLSTSNALARDVLRHTSCQTQRKSHFSLR